MLSGGGGDDSFYIYGSSAGTDQIDGGEGHDKTVGSRYSDVFGVEDNLSNLTSVEEIDGGSGGHDVVLGTDGDDTLDMSTIQLTNIDEIDGGSGPADADRRGAKGSRNKTQGHAIPAGRQAL